MRAHYVPTTDVIVASSCSRKNVEMPFAHLKRMRGLNSLRLCGRCGAIDGLIVVWV